MKCQFISVTFGIAFVLLITSPASSWCQEFRGEDQRIFLRVDSLERVDSYPERYRSPSFSYAKPDAGKDYAFIYYTRVDKQNLNISMGEVRSVGTYVIDNAGKTHKTHSETFLNIDLEATKQIKEGYIHVSLPLNASPVKLVYRYQYRIESSKKIQTAQLIVDLLNAQEAIVLDSASIKEMSEQSLIVKLPQAADSIVYQDGAYYQSGVRLSKRTIKEITEIYPAAYQEVRAGKSRHTWGYILGACGGLWLGGGISTLVFGESEDSLDPATGIGLGVASIAGAYFLFRSGSKKIRSGVRIYNLKLSNTVYSKGTTVDFGLAENGIGFTVRF